MTSTRTLLAVCTAIVILTTYVVLSQPKDSPPVAPLTRSKSAGPDQNQNRRIQIERHLAECDRQVESLLHEQLQDVRECFAAARQRVPRFSEAALGFRSKWVLLADWMPGLKVSHQDYLQQLFASQVLSGADLDRLVQHLFQSTTKEIDGLEAELLVTLTADVEHSSVHPTVPAFEPESLRLSRLVTELHQQVTTDLKADIGRELASYAAGEVVTAGMGRLGVSAGLLGAGAGSSWTTFGLGLGVGLIIDEILSRIWDWWADPVGQLTTTIDAELKQVESDLLEGRDGQPGLRSALEQLARQRSDHRRQVILEWLNAAEGR